MELLQKKMKPAKFFCALATRQSESVRLETYCCFLTAPMAGKERGGEDRGRGRGKGKEGEGEGAGVTKTKGP